MLFRSREFGWEHNQVLRDEQLKNIVINEKRLSDMVGYCLTKGWKPYLLVPPFSPNLTKLISEDILRQCLWEPLERISTRKEVPLLNFYYDERFADYRLYNDALTFNSKGKELFNSTVQEELGFRKNKIMEATTVECKKTYPLRNGVEIPWISYGTGVIWR